LVGQFEVLGTPVRFAKNCDGLDTEFLAGTNNPKSDFATIGD
jgi:hypothetical protein